MVIDSAPYHAVQTAGPRGGSRAAATSKMECFVIIINGFQPLTIITKCSILDVTVVVDPPLATKMTTSIQFPTKDVWLLTNIKGRCGRIWRPFYLKCHRGVQVLSRNNFGAIALSTYWWPHQIRQKTPQNPKIASLKCAHHHMLGVPTKGQLLVLMYFTKVWLDAMIIVFPGVSW